MKLIPALLFLVLYLLTTPVRHPYFNSPVFLAVLAIGIIASSWILAGRANGIVQWSLAATMGFLASLVSYLIAWAAQGNDGIAKFFGRFGAWEFTLNVLFAAVFSYSFVLLPVSVALGSLLSKRRGDNSTT